MYLSRTLFFIFDMSNPVYECKCYITIIVFTYVRCIPKVNNKNIYFKNMSQINTNVYTYNIFCLLSHCYKTTNKLILVGHGNFKS